MQKFAIVDVLGLMSENTSARAVEGWDTADVSVDGETHELFAADSRVGEWSGEPNPSLWDLVGSSISKTLYERIESNGDSLEMDELLPEMIGEYAEALLWDESHGSVEEVLEATSHQVKIFLMEDIVIPE